MRNITFSADENVIAAARERARSERTTLNEEFRRWLEAYARSERRSEAALALIRRMQTYVHTGGRRFSREEMNER